MNTEMKKALLADSYSALNALGHLDDGPRDYGLRHTHHELHYSILGTMAHLGLLIARLTEQIGTDNL